MGTCADWGVAWSRWCVWSHPGNVASEGGAQVFVHGNADLVKDLRRFLFVDHRHDRRLVSISGYWRTGLNEDGWQNSKRVFNEQMETEEQAALT